MELFELPRDILDYEITKYFVEIDRQILRKVCSYFCKIFPFKSIIFDGHWVEIELVHLKRYQKFWTINTMNKICGDLECLQYARSPPLGKPCPWDSDTFITIAAKGNLECLKYAYENGCPFVVARHLLNATAAAAAGGHLECLKYLHYLDIFLWDSTTTRCAAEGGHLECLKYAREIGCEWDSLTTEFAARNGHLECLKYAHSPGSGEPCPWNIETAQYTARNGHLQCLKYAHEHGCPWDEMTPALAADGGHLECLKYAHENGCPWNFLTIYYAENNNNFECLKYAYENGCPKPNI